LIIHVEYFSGLIYNIAAKYGLIPSQITVSSVEENGLTSFQIMPYFSENMLIFQDKMDQIDTDVITTCAFNHILILFLL
jgi:hypothetical protein